jgi:mRNA interferase RelE/StbE
MPTSFHKIRITREVTGLIRGMHPDLKKKVRAAFEIILGNPDRGKALKGELAGLKSFRVSNFRIIYRTSKDFLEIVTVGPRQRIYEETFLILKREGSRER